MSSNFGDSVDSGKERCVRKLTLLDRAHILPPSSSSLKTSDSVSSYEDCDDSNPLCALLCCHPLARRLEIRGTSSSPTLPTDVVSARGSLSLKPDRKGSLSLPWSPCLHTVAVGNLVYGVRTLTKARRWSVKILSVEFQSRVRVYG